MDTVAFSSLLCPLETTVCRPMWDSPSYRFTTALPLQDELDNIILFFGGWLINVFGLRLCGKDASQWREECCILNTHYNNLPFLTACKLNIGWWNILNVLKYFWDVSLQSSKSASGVVAVIYLVKDQWFIMSAPISTSRGWSGSCTAV